MKINKTTIVILIIGTLLAAGIFYYRMLISTTITIGFGGDTMLGRGVNEKINTTSTTYPWGDMLPILRANNLNMVNLENTFTQYTKKASKIFNFKADPQNVLSLVEGNISIVNLANNHIGDFENQGLLDTISALDNAGIAYVGAGKNMNYAHRPLIINKKGIKIGILAFTDNEPGWQATTMQPGVRYLAVGNKFQEHLLINEVRVLKSMADIIIVSAHWGPNRREKPTPEFIDFAHRLAKAGMNIFHGHSAHIFHGIEWYNNSLIMYDTGDFVDDYALYTDSRNDQSFLYIVKINKKGIQKVTLIPTLISNMQVNKSTGKDFDQTVKRIQKLSAQFNTKIINKNGSIEVLLK